MALDPALDAEQGVAAGGLFTGTFAGSPFAGISTHGPFVSTSAGGPFTSTSAGGPFASTSAGGPFVNTSAGGPFASTSAGGPFASTSAAGPFGLPPPLPTPSSGTEPLCIPYARHRTLSAPADVSSEPYVLFGSPTSDSALAGILGSTSLLSSLDDGAPLADDVFGSTDGPLVSLPPAPGEGFSGLGRANAASEWVLPAFGRLPTTSTSPGNTGQPMWCVQALVVPVVIAGGSRFNDVTLCNIAALKGRTVTQPCLPPRKHIHTQAN